MNVVGFAITFSFIWREYALIPFDKHKLGLFLHFIHFLITFTVYFFKYKYNYATCSDAAACRRHLKDVRSILVIAVTFSD